MTGAVHVLVGLCFCARLAAADGGASSRGTVDGMPYLALLLLAIGRAEFGEDPLDALGLDLLRVGACPWPHMAAVSLAAFALNRAVNVLILRSDLRRLVADGTIDPGGTYLALEGIGASGAVLLGIPITGSQTFVEELLFRGLIMSGGVRTAMFLGASPVAAFVSAATASSVLFGLVHFIPARRALGSRSRFLAGYALLMPAALGTVFCVLDATGKSLWPGWLVHWWLNYSAFVWDRASRLWQRAGRVRVRRPEPMPGRDDA